MSKWKLQAAMVYDMGKIRKNNEDAYYFNGKYAHLNKMDEKVHLFETFSAPGSLWSVCDGMGGQSNGEIASSTAVSGMHELQEHLRGRDFETSLQSWVRQANRVIESRTDGGGCTLVMLYVTDSYLQTAHIGDSRIYRFHDGALSRITKDHSKVEMLLSAGMITEEEARNHPQKNVITRYLGMDSEYTCEATIGRKIPLIEGDRYLLCSDGITDMITDGELEELLREYDDPEACLQEVEIRVRNNGARDNYTAMLLVVKADGKDGEKDDDESLSMTQDSDDDEPTVEQENTADQMIVNIEITSGNSTKCNVKLDNAPPKVSVRVRNTVQTA